MINGGKRYFSEDSISVIGEDDAAHRVEEHFEHGLRSESGSHNVRHSLERGKYVLRKRRDKDGGAYSSSFDVGGLGFAALLPLGVLVQDIDWRLRHILLNN
jgi:hypothetical protein